MTHLAMKKKLLSGLTAGSFLLFLLFTAFTNPLDKVSYPVIAFVILLAFIISLGYLIVYLQTGEVARRHRYRIISLGLVALTILMFRTEQSLDWVNLLILILIGYGLFFYISKRA